MEIGKAKTFWTAGTQNKMKATISNGILLYGIGDIIFTA